MSTVMTDEWAQAEGGVLLFVVSSRKGPITTVDQRSRQWELFRSAMPFRFKRAVVVQSHEEGKERLLEFLAYQKSRFMAYTSGLQTDLISTDSFGGTYQKLLRNNFDPSQIPHSLGGDFDYGMVADWVRARISIEDIMGAAPLRGNVMPHRVMTGAAGFGDPSFSQAIIGGDARPTQQAMVRRQGGRGAVGPGENREDHVKARNASHSRRAYHLRKLEMVVQHEHCARLEKENCQLRLEVQRLENLLLQAQQVVLWAHTAVAGTLPVHQMMTIAASSADTGSAGTGGLLPSTGPRSNASLVLPPHPVPWNGGLYSPQGQAKGPALPFWSSPPP
jgi:hypothetical protein